MVLIWRKLCKLGPHCAELVLMTRGWSIVHHMNVMLVIKIMPVFRMTQLCGILIISIWGSVDFVVSSEPAQEAPQGAPHVPHLPFGMIFVCCQYRFWLILSIFFNVSRVGTL